ncbi:MAG: hypothetical protein HGA96_03270 [Desulfobulbaceae bacterium]|nr:hypothetical protein [Desulfobulbaceae bacterium]
MPLRTCVHPEGRFVFGLHRPEFTVANLRAADTPTALGALPDRTPVTNSVNYPDGDVVAGKTAWIYEIPNPLPFRGVTFIKKDWADKRAADPGAIRLEPPPAVSLSRSLTTILKSTTAGAIDRAFAALPGPLLIALATTSTDPDDLVRLARLACRFAPEPRSDRPGGLLYQSDTQGRRRPVINHPELFETLVNNPHLPDPYKRAMVLRPGVQGESPIVGAVADGTTHVYEYLRANSYIGWGHYAANLADDAVRYSLAELSGADMSGLRHLYYQRTLVRMAEGLGLPPVPRRQSLTPHELEELRLAINARLAAGERSRFTATLWGWNYGFDFAPSSYRLHASHQQIHQQFALLPERIKDNEGGSLAAYACGDQIADFGRYYRQETGQGFFAAYLAAIACNRRTDGRKKGPASLVVYEDAAVQLFVPKAQTSQWELQLLCKAEVGNILEADTSTRAALDRGLFLAMQTLHGLGVKMVTSIEYSKRFTNPDRDQRLLYSLLPRLPESPGAFSEAQLRWINGHYPEDFAEACRRQLAKGEEHGNP